MCLIAVAVDCHPRYVLVLAGNRDEFHRRAAAPAHRWSDEPTLFAGRDLEKGGTWLGVSARGALSVVTNYRDPSRPRDPAAPSRGELVAGFLRDPRGDARDFLDQRARPDGPYEGFNLIAADRTGVWYGSNRGSAPRRLGRGIHGLSNHLLATPWPKVRHLTGALAEVLSTSEDEVSDEALFGALHDRTVPPDADLPDTGVGIDWERRLGPAFIVSPDYGTRCSTLAKVSRDGMLHLEERTFSPAGALVGIVRARMPMAPGFVAGLAGGSLSARSSG